MHAVEKEKLPRLSLGEERNMVTQLMLVNLTVFILLLFTRVIYNMEAGGDAQFNRDIMSWTMLPADPGKLISRPWTLITAMFTHIEFWQIFSNMIWLWCFGTLLQNFAGYQRILPLYLLGGVTGAVFYIAGMHLIPAFDQLVPHAATMGASASVMAVAAGVTLIAPRHRIFPLLSGGIPLWVITLVFTGVHLSSILFSTHNNTLFAPLLGGILAGVLYMQQWKRGRDLGAGFNKVAFKFTHIFHPPAERIHPETLKKQLENAAKNTSQPYKRIGKVPEQRVNEILDKINMSGINTLTPEERETLLRASKGNEQ